MIYGDDTPTVLRGGKTMRFRILDKPTDLMYECIENTSEDAIKKALDLLDISSILDEEAQKYVDKNFIIYEEVGDNVFVEEKYVPYLKELFELGNKRPFFPFIKFSRYCDYMMNIKFGANEEMDNEPLSDEEFIDWLKDEISMYRK